jgi:hypothetical protein
VHPYTGGPDIFGILICPVLLFVALGLLATGLDPRNYGKVREKPRESLVQPPEVAPVEFRLMMGWQRKKK